MKRLRQPPCARQKRVAGPASVGRPPSAAAAIALLVWLAAAAAFAAPPARTGQFDLAATVERLLDGPSLDSFAQLIPADTPIEWSVLVPEGYDPERPPGLLVYISPGDSGRIPRQWRPIMERRNLIWIGAHGSGNTTHTTLRIAYAILAPIAIRESYEVDAERIYLSGFSGGGRVASMVAADYAHIFKGGIYNCGANVWTGDRPRRYEEMKANHFVFVTGGRDFNLGDTKQVYRAYRAAGIANVKLMVIPRMGHENPAPAHYERAVQFLDSRVAAPAE